MLDGVGHLADQAAGALRHLHEVLAGLEQLLGESAREHRIRIGVIIGQTIERGLTGTCREHREHAFGQLRHRTEPAAAGDCAGPLALERVVAAGVEHQDRGPRLLVLQALDDTVGQDRGVAHQLFLSFRRRRHVGRQQIILAGDLEAVAGIEEERGVARLDRLVERKQRLGELLPALVLGDHHREAKLLQRVTHGACVVDRLEQLRDVPVFIVADDERDAFVGIGGSCEAAQARREPKGRQNSEKPTRHRKFPVAERPYAGSFEQQSMGSPAAV